MFLKVIACEIAVRELYHTAARCPNLVDLEFLTQGYHDVPATGLREIQKRIDAVPAGKYDAILLGYGLCSNILNGITTAHTPLVVPRAHDCITFLLGSKERYQSCFQERPGTYYFSSGWLECATRRGEKSLFLGSGASAPASLNMNVNYQQWVEKYGEDQAKFLIEEMGRWANAYSHGTLIDFDFTKPLDLEQRVKTICDEKGWERDRLPGDLRLFEKILAGDWPESEFLTVRPGEKIIASYDDGIIKAVPNEPASPNPAETEKA
jgi:hypothetical protein